MDGIDPAEVAPWLACVLLTLALAPLALAANPPWARAALGLLAVLCLYLYLRRALGQALVGWRLHPAHAPAAGYLLLALLRPLGSVHPDASVAWLPVWLAAVAVFWLLSQAGEADLWRLALLLAGSGAVQALLGVAVDPCPAAPSPATESANWWHPTALAWSWQGAALARLADTGGGDPFRRQALGAVQRAISRDPYSPALYSQMAGLRESLGDRPGAIASRRRATLLQPYHLRCRVELAEALVLAGDAGSALDLLADVANHWDRYAWLGVRSFGTEAGTDWYLRTRLDLVQVASSLGQRRRALTVLQDLAGRYPGEPAVAALQRQLSP